MWFNSLLIDFVNSTLLVFVLTYFIDWVVYLCRSLPKSMFYMKLRTGLLAFISAVVLLVQFLNKHPEFKLW